MARPGARPRTTCGVITMSSSVFAFCLFSSESTYERGSCPTPMGPETERWSLLVRYPTRIAGSPSRRFTDPVNCRLEMTARR